jgi:hypothetical protein
MHTSLLGNLLQNWVTYPRKERWCEERRRGKIERGGGRGNNYLFPPLPYFLSAHSNF